MQQDVSKRLMDSTSKMIILVFSAFCKERQLFCLKSIQNWEQMIGMSLGEIGAFFVVFIIWGESFEFDCVA